MVISGTSWFNFYLWLLELGFDVIATCIGAKSTLGRLLTVAYNVCTPQKTREVDLTFQNIISVAVWVHPGGDPPQLIYYGIYYGLMLHPLSSQGFKEFCCK